MKFRAKLTIAMVLLLSLTYGIGGSLMIAQSFSSSIDRERDAAHDGYDEALDPADGDCSYNARDARHGHGPSGGRQSAQAACPLLLAVLQRGTQPPVWGICRGPLLLISRSGSLWSKETAALEKFF